MSRWAVPTVLAAAVTVMVLGCAQPLVMPARDEDNRYTAAPAAMTAKAPGSPR